MHLLFAHTKMLINHVCIKFHKKLVQKALQKLNNKSYHFKFKRRQLFWKCNTATVSYILFLYFETYFFYLSSGTKIYPFELFTLQFDTRFIVLESIDTLQRAHWYIALFSQAWKIWSNYLKNISFAIRRKVRLLFVPWTLKVFLHIMNMILLLKNLKLHLQLFCFNFPNCSFLQEHNFLSWARDFARGRLSLRDRLISALQSSFCNPQFVRHAISFVSCNITCICKHLPTLYCSISWMYQKDIWMSHFTIKWCFNAICVQNNVSEDVLSIFWFNQILLNT